MKTFEVTIIENQKWEYIYKVKGLDKASAKKKAKVLFNDGEQANSSYVLSGKVIRTKVK